MKKGIASAKIVLFLAFLFLIPAGSVFGQFALEIAWPPEVDVSAPESGFPSGGTADLSLVVSPDFGLHLYRDRIRVDLETQQGISFKELVVPEGTLMLDPADPDKEVMVIEDEFRVLVRFQVTAAESASIEIQGTLLLQGCTDELCYPPEEVPFAWSGVAAPGKEGGASAGGGNAEATQADDSKSPAPVQAESIPPSSDRETPKTEESVEMGEILITIFWAFIAGIMLSLTPCVLPMIPITSAIILRFSKPGIGSALFSSCIYVLGLALTYALAGVGVAFVGGALRSVFNAPWFLGLIAAIFTILALSMFGLFDIALPSGLAGKLQQRSSQSGKNRIGLLFMGMISGLIVGPCVTAPIAGIFVFIAKVGSPMVGFWTMFTLAWGMGLLIIAAGTFTGLVPKAGAWTEWFKKLFGFVMLWGALFFLRSLIGGIAYELGTAGLLVVASVFLGGFDHLPVDAHWGLRLRKLIGVLCMTMALLLGFDFFLTQHDANRPAVSTAALRQNTFVPGGRAELDMAAEQNRPAVLYFTAEWCDICKTLKKKTLFEPEVAEALRGVVALEVDYDKEGDLVKTYNVPGPPTMVFIDRGGKERESLRVSGFQSVLELTDRIRRLTTR
ncbi:MAG: protein-disulfide reductase DsbD [Planctomycetes bacterium]|nr:protein-disulfide reductase DsbD [Planctomycetota bacterium]